MFCVFLCCFFFGLDAAGGNKQSATFNQKRLDDEDDIVQREFAPCARECLVFLQLNHRIQSL
jgi:hypothetical protein